MLHPAGEALGRAAHARGLPGTRRCTGGAPTQCQSWRRRASLHKGMGTRELNRVTIALSERPMSESSMRIETKLVHAGEPLPRIARAGPVPIFQSAAS